MSCAEAAAGACASKRLAALADSGGGGGAGFEVSAGFATSGCGGGRVPTDVLLDRASACAAWPVAAPRIFLSYPTVYYEEMADSLHETYMRICLKVTRVADKLHPTIDGPILERLPFFRQGAAKELRQQCSHCTFIMN